MTNRDTDAHLPELVFEPTEGTDFELDYRGVIDDEDAWEWTSCGPTFSDEYSSDDTFSSRAAAIQDATTFLSGLYDTPPAALEAAATLLDIELAEISPYECGVHFALCTYEEREGVYWQGLCQEPGEAGRWWGEGDFSEYVSDRGYFNAHYAAADAIYCFHRLRGHSAEDSLTLCYELGLPVHQIIEEHFIRLTVSQASGYGSAAGDVYEMNHGYLRMRAALLALGDFSVSSNSKQDIPLNALANYRQAMYLALQYSPAAIAPVEVTLPNPFGSTTPAEGLEQAYPQTRSTEPVNVEEE